MDKFTELYEDGLLEEALEHLENIKEEGINYYEYVSLKATVLKDLGRYDEAIDLVAEELKMPYIPVEYDEGFNELYSEIVMLKKESLGQSTTGLSKEELEEVLTNSDNFDLIMQALLQLKDYNIRSIADTLKNYLRDETKDSMIKTLMLELLNDQDYNEEVLVVKNNNTYTVNPVNLETVIESKALAHVSKMIENNLDKDPSKKEIGFQLLDYYLYDVYPELPREEEFIDLGCAIEIRVDNLLGEDTINEDYINKYKAKKTNVMKMLLKLESF
jgi:tetratricopeptide (TPR) repeat protein